MPKRLALGLIALFVVAGSVGYLFVFLRGERQRELKQTSGTASIEPSDIIQRALEQRFDYREDGIAATVLAKTHDEDGNPALRLYISWPPGSPLYDQEAIVTVDCFYSDLVFKKPPTNADEKTREETLLRDVDFFEAVNVNDVMRALCLNEYCSHMGGACAIERTE